MSTDNIKKLRRQATYLGLISLTCFVIFVASTANIVITYLEEQDMHKKTCFDKYKTIEYEYIADELYCIKAGELIKLEEK